MRIRHRKTSFRSYRNKLTTKNGCFSHVWMTVVRDGRFVLFYTFSRLISHLGNTTDVLSQSLVSIARVLCANNERKNKYRFFRRHFSMRSHSIPMRSNIPIQMTTDKTDITQGRILEQYFSSGRHFPQIREHSTYLYVLYNFTKYYGNEIIKICVCVCVENVLEADVTLCTHSATEQMFAQVVCVLVIIVHTTRLWAC